MRIYEKIFKKPIGILLALLSLPFVLIITLILKPIVYLEDRGPLFYVSKRAGKNSKTFLMYKFRSMKVNSPNILNSDGSTYNSENDERQTRVGKFLRKTSIDELPQIFNILKGDMSWIGPRPVLESQVSSFTKEELGKFMVLPGITGYSQAYNRNQLSNHDERMLDAWYAENVSFFLDVKIVFKTIDTIMHPSRVYRNKETAVNVEEK